MAMCEEEESQSALRELPRPELDLYSDSDTGITLRKATFQGYLKSKP